MKQEDPAILIPAAGAARRMGGRDKLMEPVDGTPLIVRQVRMARATGCRVMVTLPDHGPRYQSVKGSGAELAVNAGASEGLAASLRAGAAWAQGCKAPALMILLADLPELTGEDLHHMIAAWRSDAAAVWRAYDEDGTPGHPVVCPARLFGGLLTLQGDTGAARLFTGEDVRPVPLPDHRATTDLDTPEDWAAWRARRGK